MIRKEQMIKNLTTKSEEWFRNILKNTLQKPKIVPVVGVKIECRILVTNISEWQYVQDTLEHAQQFGAAEIVEYKIFEE